MTFAFSFFLAMLASSAMVAILLKKSRSLLLDTPDGNRKLHDKSVSRSGGLAISAASIIAILFAFLEQSGYTQIVIAGAIVVGFGFLDDYKNLSYKWKLLGQIISVLVAMDAGVIISNLPFLSESQSHPAFSSLVTFFFLLGVTNAVNLSDGLDGLAAGTTLLSLGITAALAYLSGNYEVVVMACAVMGALGGFLRYNTHPASLFMGDSGSQFIGFMSAVLIIQATQHSDSGYSPLLALIVLGLPILDTAYVMAARVRLGRSPFIADRKHIHYQIMSLGFRHHESVAVIYLAQALLVSLAFKMRYSSDVSVLSTYVLFCLSFVVLLLVGRFSGWKFRDQRHSRALQDRRNPLFHAISRYYKQITLTLAALTVSTFYISALLGEFVHSSEWVLTATVTLGLFLLAFSKNNVSSLWMLRLCTYSAAVLLFYSISPIEIESGGRYVLDLYLGISALVLALCFRISRRANFSLNTQDLLVLCVFLILPVLQVDKGTIYLAIRIGVVLYIVEYLIAVARPHALLFNYSAIGCLAVLCWRPFLV